MATPVPRARRAADRIAAMWQQVGFTHLDADGKAMALAFDCESLINLSHYSRHDLTTLRALAKQARRHLHRWVRNRKVRWETGDTPDIVHA